MESIIEIQRQNHEEIELYQQALADILVKQSSNPRTNLRNQHKALDVLNRIAAQQTDLLKLYNDEQGLRAKELDLLSSAASSSKQETTDNVPADLSEFYTRLSSIQSYHARHPHLEPASKLFTQGLEELVASDGLTRITETPVVGDPDEDGTPAKPAEPITTIIDPLSSMFTGEESLGRHLDLYTAHTMYVNLPGAKRMGYMAWLQNVLGKGRVAGEEIGKKGKESAGYHEYVSTLKEYLLGFLRRTHPLRTGEIENALAPVEAEFEKEWKEGKVEGWQQASTKTTDQNQGGNSEGAIWCAACAKHYAKQTVYDAHLTSKKHIKAAEKLAEQGDAPPPPASSSSTTTPLQSTASASRNHMSALLTRLTETLLFFPPIPSLIDDTIQEIQRKSALTAREREQELEEPLDEFPADTANGETGETAEEAEERIYNPLKLPLGWDGKPIPYWLYKLHGLGVEYKCEICSDYVYMGRKAFDRHFQESRHAFGMRALGLPNTKHFHEITKIKDALALAERLKQEGRAEQHATERTEEFEDSEGNVYDKKTYEDLKRQGLI